MNLEVAINYIISLFTLKKSVYLFSFLTSFSVSASFKQVTEHIDIVPAIGPIITLSILIFISGFFSLVDLITGVIAARKQGHKLQSSKWGVTIGKFFGIFLFFFLSTIIIVLLPSNYIIDTVIFGFVVLVILKEYISIGENFEKINGKKPYAFTLMDKVFNVLELKFFKKIQNDDNDDMIGPINNNDQFIEE